MTIWNSRGNRSSADSNGEDGEGLVPVACEIDRRHPSQSCSSCLVAVERKKRHREREGEQGSVRAKEGIHFFGRTCFPSALILPSLPPAALSHHHHHLRRSILHAFLLTYNYPHTPSRPPGLDLFLDLFIANPRHSFYIASAPLATTAPSHHRRSVARRTRPRLNLAYNQPTHCSIPIHPQRLPIDESTASCDQDREPLFRRLSLAVV